MSAAASATKQALQTIWAATHSATGPSFGEAVAKLAALNVIRYHVDYTSNVTTSYIRSEPSSTAVDTAPIPAHAASVAPTFNADKVTSAIRTVQRGEGNYPWFARECMAAGVAGYICFIEGKRVLYYGAQGDQHVEWFPGAKA